MREIFPKMCRGLEDFSRNLACFTPCLALVLVSGCGGGSGASDTSSMPPSRLLATAAASSPDYTTVVQQLYIAYFGRPADPVGMADFQAQLAALGAPNDIQALEQAYDTNAGIKALIDGFGNSAESAKLHSGTNAQFISAIYQNLFGRDPLIAGLDFWTSQVASGSLTRARTALSIMASALRNNSVQGRADAASINQKIIFATIFTKNLANLDQRKYNGTAVAWATRFFLQIVPDFGDIVKVKGLVAETLSSYVANSAIIPFSKMTDHWSAVFYGKSLSDELEKITISLDSSLVNIKVEQSVSGTCTYSAKLNSTRNNVESGTYQCSDTRAGTWKLYDMHRIGIGDVYLTISRDGKDVQNFYGMSVLNPMLPQQILPSPVSDAAGEYYAVFAPYESFTEEPEKKAGPASLQALATDRHEITKMNLKVVGDDLTILFDSLYSGNCKYQAKMQLDKRSLAGETFNCSNGQTGTWKLIDLRVMPENGVQLAFLANGHPHRVYGLR